MSRKDEFLKEYQSGLSAALVLPAALCLEYRACSCLKSGGEREVWLVRDREDRPFILKLQPSGRPDSLRGEHEVLSRLAHSGVPDAVCFLEENGKEYLVRTYIEGNSLQELVGQNGPFPARMCLKLIQSLCDLLQYLHGQDPPVIHRDIKPQNVLLRPDGSCALIDFGAARYYKKGQASDTVFIGTQATAPPEQFGYGQTDNRADIYAVGMLLRYLLTGSLETGGPGKMPSDLAGIVRRCTAFDPRKRFRNVRRLKRVLAVRLHRKTVWAAAAAAAALLTAGLLFCSCRENAGVTFQNALLEEAVRLELKLSPAEPIPEKRLEEVTQLLLCGNAVMTDWESHAEKYNDLKNDSTLWTGWGEGLDLHELARFPNLRVLALDYQNLSELSALQDMELQYLSLCGNRIRDLTPLAGMETLRALWVEDNPISDPAPLSSLHSLYDLEISATDLREVETVSALPLHSLRIRDTLITDLSPLQKMAGLRVLAAGEVDAAGMRVIESLPMLEELTVSGPVSDLTPFHAFSRLQMLDLSMSGLTSLKGAEKLPKLEYLGFGYTALESLEPLTGSASLLTVEMVGAQIPDYTPLKSCKKLQTVNVGFSQREEAERQLAGSGLEILAWEE